MIISDLPDWEKEEYHNYEQTIEKINSLKEKYYDLLSFFPIGKSVLGKDILCVKIKSKNKAKYSCLIDGCIHGSEWESGELCLYFLESLLKNYGKDKNLSKVMDMSEINVIPILNPDGRQKDRRWNENGVDLNRNFDVHYGRIFGGSVKRTKSKDKFTNLWFFINCGKKAFSEPETLSFKEYTEILNQKNFSFYVNCHTASQKIISPTKIMINPQYSLKKEEKEIFNYAKNEISKITPYENKESISLFGYGNACDWIFKEYRIPSFNLELLSKDYTAGFGKGKHDKLNYWMKKSIPALKYLLQNIEKFDKWKVPNIKI